MEDETESSIELTDLDEEGNPIQKKEPKKNIPTNNSKKNYYILILIIILSLFTKFYYFNYNRIYYKFKNIEDINRNISESIISLIKKKPNARIGIIHAKPLYAIYDYLINKYEKGEISFKDVKFFSFDGICGLQKDSNSSYYHFLTENFLNKIDAKKENIFLISEEGYLLFDFKNSADKYNDMLEINPLDLQIILFDENGNIGLNDEFTDYDLDSHVVKLDVPFRINLKDMYFGTLEKTPIYGITQGIKNILETKEIIALGLGKDKAKIVKILANGVFIKKYPITVLCKHRGNVKVYTDEEAGSLIEDSYKKF